MLALLSLNAGDEKIIMQLIKMDYVFSYKLSMVILFILAFAIIHGLKRNVQQIHPKIVPVYSSILIILTVLSVIVPMEYLVTADMVTIGSVFVSMVIVIISLIRSKLSFSDHFGLILASIAIISHFAWFSYALKSGTKVMFYPFDLIIAVICLATVWFKHYYAMNVKFKIQADKLAKADKEKDLLDRKSTRLNSSHVAIAYAVFCLKKKTRGAYRSLFSGKQDRSCFADTRGIRPQHCSKPRRTGRQCVLRYHICRRPSPCDGQGTKA